MMAPGLVPHCNEWTSPPEAVGVASAFPSCGQQLLLKHGTDRLSSPPASAERGRRPRRSDSVKVFCCVFAEISPGMKMSSTARRWNQENTDLNSLCLQLHASQSRPVVRLLRAWFQTNYPQSNGASGSKNKRFDKVNMSALFIMMRKCPSVSSWVIGKERRYTEK